MNPDTISFSRRRLPHWFVAGRSYFVTIRIRGTLPWSVVEKLKRQKESLISNGDEKALLNYERHEFLVIERILDSVKNVDNAYLADDNIAPILMEAFAAFERKYCWRIPTFVIMPNHIHCLCLADKDGEKVSLTKFLGGFKRFTARRLNQIRNQKVESGSTKTSIIGVATRKKSSP